MRRQRSSSTVFLLILAIFGVVLTGYVSLRNGQQPATMTGRFVGRTAHFPTAAGPEVLPIDVEVGACRRRLFLEARFDAQMQGAVSHSCSRG